MYRYSFLIFCCLLLLSGNVLAAGGLQKLPLETSDTDNHVLLQVKEEREGILTLEFTLPFLNLEEITAAGELYQGLSIPGGNLRGQPGQAGLPSVSYLIAIPDHAAVQVDVTAKQEHRFQHIRVFPVQPDDSDKFHLDRAYYSSGALDAPALVELGAPAIMHGLRVVPLTISPVSFEPLKGEITVASHLEIAIGFSGQDTRNAVAPRRSLVPESFDHLYRDVVVNYDDDGAAVGPGSYLIITPNNASVITDLQPLLDWRRRQGYNVMLATTDETGNTANSIKSYIRNLFGVLDPPLEFVVLAGDAGGSFSIPCWYESLSGYGGEGDHYYTTLVGGDVLADVHIGRLSFRTEAELQAIVNKIVTYETNPPTIDPGWFTRAALVGDTSPSGITTIYVNQWVKSHLLNLGYTQIDTIWGGNFVTQMTNSLNQGLTVFGYRGYLGMSDFGTSHISYLSNGMELPFALIPTCATGSFASDSNCRSEAFLRNGNGGGIGAIGTATIGTHTRYNNCYYMGTWDGALNGNDHRLGFAHSRGKLSLYYNYINYEPVKVEIWSMWNNLMGDPATPMWTAYPATMSVDHASSLPVGANSLPVTVTDGVNPVMDALVSLFKDGEIRVAGYSDFNGQVNLPLAGYSAGQVLVTVTKHNQIPYQGSVNMGAVGSFPAFADATIDDDNVGDSRGNGNGVINPTETVELPVALQNLGSSLAGNVTATLSSNDTYVTITDATEDYGDISPGAIVWSAEDFDFIVAPDAPAGHILNLDLVASSGGNEYTSLIQLPVSSAAFDFEGFTWSGPGGDLDPGESGTITITLRNTGDITATNLLALLSTPSPWVTVTDPSGDYEDMPPGATGETGADSFALTISPDCFQGHLATFTLTLQFNGGAFASTEFSLAVGSVSSDDPIGPDGYGYYAFDNSDTGYPFTPIYQWVEIDPNYGGNGTSVGLTDFGWEQDDTEVLDLPFTFQYYGEFYDQVSICSNGWISMGVTSLRPYRNFTIPGVGAPPALIAPYWDNLYQTGSNQVYSYNDSENGRFIVEWSRMRADYNNMTQTVQVILYNPAVYPTSTGDGEILFQFQTVSNTDSRDGYATVGIQNQDCSDGILYTYGNHYSPGAPSLTAGRAIHFVPVVGLLNLGTLSGQVTNASNGGTPVTNVNIRVLEAGRTLISAGDGSYAGSIQAGTYTVRAEHASFESVTIENVTIEEGETTILDFALDDILGPDIQNTTNLPSTDDTTGPYVVDTIITDFSDIVEMHFYYRLFNGSAQEVTLDPVDLPSGHYRAEIPGQALDTPIEYWLEATDVADNHSRDPEGTDNYSFWILESVIAFADDMEADQGWSVGDAGDDATTGIWVRVDPVGVWDGGTEVQPEDDATPGAGVLCWITGNGEDGNQGTDDVDGGKTTLMSPVFDLSGTMSVTASYRRWFTNDTGFSPGEDGWVVEVNDGSGWVSLENTTTSDRSWALQSFLLDDHIDLTSTVQFRFIASDEGGGSVVEAGVDEFLLTGFIVPQTTPVTEGAMPTRLALHQNHPNPFNPSTSIGFDLPRNQTVSLRIYDVSGRLVRILVHQHQLPAGSHRYTWDGRDDGADRVGSGLYFYVLDTSVDRLTGKMTMVK